MPRRIPDPARARPLKLAHLTRNLVDFAAEDNLWLCPEGRAALKTLARVLKEDVAAIAARGPAAAREIGLAPRTVRLWRQEGFLRPATHHLGPRGPRKSKNPGTPASE